MYRQRNLHDSFTRKFPDSGSKKLIVIRKKDWWVNCTSFDTWDKFGFIQVKLWTGRVL